MTDEPGCTLLPPPAVSTCYCTGRRGCLSPRSDDGSCEHCGEPTCAGDCDGDHWLDEENEFALRRIVDAPDLSTWSVP